MNPKISVLMPTWHSPGHPRIQWLPEAVASILAQDVDLELLIVDNGSTQETGDYLKSLGDTRVRWWRLDENNLPEASHILRENAAGEYATTMCDDDRLLPGALRPCIELLDAHPEAGVSWMEGASRTVTFEDIFAHHQCPMMGTVFRSEYLPLMGNYNYVSGDWMFFVDVLSRTNAMTVTGRSLDIRFHGDSHTESEGYGQGKFVAEHLIMWKQWLDQGYHPPARSWEIMETQFKWELDYTRNMAQERKDDLLRQFQALREIR